MISVKNALAGREEPMQITGIHFVNQISIKPPFAPNTELAMFGMGCFWGAEKLFWPLEGVQSTAVGYAAGVTPNPNYQEVCTGQTGHNEVVLIVFEPSKISYSQLLNLFWQGHNPTQGMQQGNDRGTQYRSGIYTFNANQEELAQGSLQAYQTKLTEAKYSNITTEIIAAPTFYYAEDAHQQYLAKNPNGYCGLGGTGVCV